MKKRIISILMALVMALSLLPAGALFGSPETQDDSLPKIDAAPHIMVVRA